MSRAMYNTLTKQASDNHVKAWFYEMKGHSAQCVARYLELADLQEKDLKRVSTPCIDDHLLDPKDFETKGALHKVAARIVLKALYTARIRTT